MPKQKFVESMFAKCTYYKHELQSVICCEGAEENSSIHMAFASSTQRKLYGKKFCQGCWKSCLIADALNRKWDYEA